MSKNKLTLVCCSIYCFSATAQPANLDSVKTELYLVNKVFDSSRYLAFDVIYRMKSDTSFGKFGQDEMAVSYIINNKNLYYRTGEEEFLQTDSFSYSIYHDDRTIIMSREEPLLVGNRFPLREFLDSIITWYDTAYSIRLTQTDTMHAISFVALIDSVPYSRFAIYYRPGSYLPTAIEMETREAFDRGDIPDTLLAKVSLKPVKRKLTMSFLNYTFPNTLEVFDDSKYVIYDRFRRHYQVAAKYRDYELITNNMETSRRSPNAEMYPEGTEPEPID